MMLYYTRRLLLCCCTLVVLLLSANVLAQNLDVLYDFNNCAVPTGWQSTGQGSGLWGVGMPANAGLAGSTIDGTCLLYFDDDGNGNNQPAWSRRLTSPVIDATVNTHIYLDLDVAYRDGDYSPNTDSLVISVFDGTAYRAVKTYSRGEQNTGNLFSDFEHLHLNITQYANAALRVRVEFWDGNIWGWWAAVDNIHLTGQGEGENLLIQNFNACTNPAGWTTYVQNGNDDWQFGQHHSGSIDGCMAYFDDDGIGEDAVPSRVFLSSPIFDGTEFANITLELDATYRYYASDYFAVLVYDGSNYQNVATYSGENLGGENMSAYEHLTLDLSPYRSAQMQVVFLYDDAGTWNWWMGIDNVQVSGYGDINDLCTKAIALNMNQACVAASNINALLVGPAAVCADSIQHGIWFSFQPTTTTAKIETTADFNELISVFSGNCNSLTPIACRNNDEYGFVGESVLLTGLTPNATYWVRVSGVMGEWGKTSGTVCIRASSGGTNPPAPTNDLCTGAIPISVGATNCTAGNNRYANMENPIPQRNTRSRASVWYSFVAPAGGRALIETQADYADVISVYSGSNCNSLSEIASNDYGQSLLLTNLTAGQSYRIQITGYFSTVEGSQCVRISTPPAAPTTDVCTNALALTLGGSCVSATNIGAQFTGALANLQLALTAEGYSSHTSGKSTFVRPNDGNTCTLSDVTTYYDVVPISVSQTGTYTITNTYSPNYDGYLQVYVGAFNPANPCATYLNGNDDFGSIAASQLIGTLQAGQTYYIVTSSYNGYESGDYTLQMSGAGSITRYLQNVNVHGMPTTCELLPSAPIWFSFVAPASGMVKVNSGADFVHTLSLYDGICGDLNELDCAFNPSACDAPVVFEHLTPNKTYFIQVASARSAFGYTEGNVCLSIKDAGIEAVKAKIKVLLQGAYIGNGNMRTTLRDNNLLPSDQPYNTAPWNYNGRECANTIPASAVDWVLIELRSALNPDLVVEQKAAWLLSNGSVVSNNSDGVLFDNINNGQNYYIVVRHRNHLAIMSANTVQLPNVTTFNFSTNGAAAAMGGATQIANLGDGYYALRAGDLNANGVVTVHDFNYYVSQSSAINTYNAADCTLDKVVSVTDFNTYQPNASATGVAYIRY